MKSSPHVDVNPRTCGGEICYRERAQLLGVDNSTPSGKGKVRDCCAVAMDGRGIEGGNSHCLALVLVNAGRSDNIHGLNQVGW